VSSATVIDALEKRGYITVEARDRIMQKRAHVITKRIADVTADAFSKEAGFFSRVGEKMKGIGDVSQSMAAKGVTAKGWSDWVADMARVMGVGAGLAAGGAAVGAAGHAIGNIGAKGKIKKSKSEVMGMLAEKNPEIARQQEEVFDAIARYAPTLASDPLIATGIVQGIAKGTGGMSRNLPHVDANFAKGLAEAEQRINDSRSGTRFGKIHEKVHTGVANQFSFGDKG
jgi:hypothetical protein